MSTISKPQDAALRPPSTPTEVKDELSVEVASQWQLMWWKFRKHRLAMIGAIIVLMFYFVAKYRRRKGHIAQRSPSHNTPLEIAWTVIPTLFLVWIFFKGFWTYMDKMMAPGDAIVMDLRASKWNWNLIYPNGSESSTRTMIAAKSIPIGTAYAVWTGIGAVGTAILGIVLFGDPATALRIGCIALIVCGIVGLKLVS